MVRPGAGGPVFSLLSSQYWFSAHFCFLLRTFTFSLLEADFSIWMRKLSANANANANAESWKPVLWDFYLGHRIGKGKDSKGKMRRLWRRKGRAFLWKPNAQRFECRFEWRIGGDEWEKEGRICHKWKRAKGKLMRFCQGWLRFALDAFHWSSMEIPKDMRKRHSATPV